MAGKFDPHEFARKFVENLSNTGASMSYQITLQEIRQTALHQALELVRSRTDTMHINSESDVLRIAKTFEDYLTGK